MPGGTKEGSREDGEGQHRGGGPEDAETRPEGLIASGEAREGVVPDLEAAEIAPETDASGHVRDEQLGNEIRIGHLPSADARVLDLGCGTGRLTLAIARTGASVSGVDPDEASILAARQKPGSDRVEWVLGDSRAIGADQRFDAAIMSSNVVQAILEDRELSRTFRDVAAHMPPGGQLAFDARDPRARGWEDWTKERSLRTIQLPEGPSHHWYQTTRVDESRGLVDFCAHEMDADGRERKECDRLRFRDEEHLRSLLTDAGFHVDAVFGGFHREPVRRGIGSLVVIARRA